MNDRIHSSLTTVHCFDNGYVGKQPVSWKEYCAVHWSKELQESMDGYNGRREITEILLELAIYHYYLYLRVDLRSLYSEKAEIIFAFASEQFE